MPRQLYNANTMAGSLTTSKVQKVFDEVARLPRRQQEKIVEVVSALMTQYEQRQ